MPSFDCCIAVSPSEARAFAQLGAQSAEIPNGVDAQPPPEPLRPLRSGEPLRLLFVGSQDYVPNRQGLAWFIREVAPRLHTRVDFELTVVGRGRVRMQDRNITFTGHVPDIGAVFRDAHVCIVPLLSGGGSRLKVVEALARGTPLVGTPLGVEGFGLVHGSHGWFTDDPLAFADQLAHLSLCYRRDLAQVQGVVTRGYEHASHYFWDVIGTRLIDLYHRLVSRNRGADLEL